ncbi:MAG: copper resistance protein B [Pseudomonadota bacterium]
MLTPGFAAEAVDASGDARWRAAEAHWGTDAMQASKQRLLAEHSGGRVTLLEVDRMEGLHVDDDWEGRWDVTLAHGDDEGRFYLRSEGEYEAGVGLSEAEFYAGYSLPIAPFWNFQAGLRHDSRPHRGRSFIGVGLEGTLPFWVEMHAEFYAAEDGQALMRLEAEQDIRLARRWRLQPHAEVEMALKEQARFELRPGYNEAQLGVRLFFDIRPDVSTYIGYEYGHLALDQDDDDRTQSKYSFGFRFWW